MTPGTRVDRYVVEARIATGQAQVYRVRHETLGTLRALKVQAGTDGESVREGRIQAALDHPSLVRVVDVVDVEGLPGLVLEYVEGPTLGDLLRDAPPRLEEGLRLFRQILSGVAHAHAAGLVHRDLTPANILLDVAQSPPVARVTDFGAARADNAAGRREGTPGYCAPEQLRGDETHPTADVFSLGVLLHELCTGRLPYPQVDRDQLLAAMDSGQRDPMPAGLPSGIEHVVDACLAPDPADRPPNAGALLDALDVEPVVVPERPSRGPLVAFAALAVVTGGLAAWGAGLQRDLEAAVDQTEAAELLYAAARVREGDPASAVALLRAVSSLRGEDRVPDREAATLLYAGAATLRLDQPGALTIRVDLSDELVALADERPTVRVLRRDTGEEVVSFDSGMLRPTRLALDDQDRWLVLSAPGDPVEATNPVAAWELPSGRPLVTAPATPSWAQGLGGLFDTVLVVYDQVSGERRAELRQLPDGAVLWREAMAAGSTATLSGDGQGVILPSDDGWKLLGRDGQVQQTWDAGLAPMVAPDGETWAHRVEGPGVWLHDASGPLGSAPELAARLAFSMDGSMLAGVDSDERLHAIRTDGLAVVEWPNTAKARAVVGMADGFLVGTSHGEVYAWTPDGESRIHRGLRSRVISIAEQGGAIAGSDLEGRAALWQDPHRHPGTIDRRITSRAPWSQVQVEDDAILLDDGTHVPLPEALRVMRRGIVRLGGSTLVATGSQIVQVADDGSVLHSESLSQIGRLHPFDDEHALVVHGATARFSIVDATGQLVRSAHAETEQAISSLEHDGVLVHAGTFCGRVFRFDGPDAVQLADIGSPVSALAVDGDRVAAGTWDGRVVLVDETGELWTWTLGRQIVGLVWTSSGLVAADEDGMLSWLGPDGQLLAVRQGHAPGKVRLSSVNGLWSHGDDDVLLSWDTDRVAAEPPTLERTGAWSNLRVCREDGSVVPVLPFPSPESVWAPEASCSP